MSNSKSPLYSALAILVSLVVLAGGAAKLYRGYSRISSSESSAKVDELLEESDATVAEANRQSVVLTPAFRELLGDFDKLGIDAFRSEKQEACTKLSEQFAAVSEQLNESSRLLIEATKHGTNEKLTGFLLAKSKSYELQGKVNTEHIDMIRALLDESIVDVDAIVQKIQSITASAVANRKAADEAAEESAAILKQAKM